MKVSACLIVRNEQFWIRHCLGRLQAYPVDEVIVVDGGSEDHTAKIIEKEFPYVKLYHRPMPYSFADQRNFAKEQATGDWILSLDADETIDNAQHIKVLITDPKLIAYSFPTDHVTQIMDDVDPHVRLFKNRPDIKWEREIHEYLTFEGVQLKSHPGVMGIQRNNLIGWVPTITVVHWAYVMSTKQLQEKAEWYKKYNKIQSGISVSKKTLIPGNRIEEY